MSEHVRDSTIRSESNVFEVQVLFNSLVILEILILKFEYGFSKFKSHTIIATWGTWLNETQFTPPIHDLFQINWLQVMILLPKRDEFHQIQTYVSSLTHGLLIIWLECRNFHSIFKKWNFGFYITRYRKNRNFRIFWWILFPWNVAGDLTISEFRFHDLSIMVQKRK